MSKTDRSRVPTWARSVALVPFLAAAVLAAPSVDGGQDDMWCFTNFKSKWTKLCGDKKGLEVKEYVPANSTVSLYFTSDGSRISNGDGTDLCYSYKNTHGAGKTELVRVGFQKYGPDGNQKKVTDVEQRTQRNTGLVSTEGVLQAGAFDGAGGFQSSMGAVDHAVYGDGTLVTSNGPNETIIGAEILFPDLLLEGPSPQIPGAFRLSDGFVNITNGSNIDLSGTMTDVLLIPCDDVPGFDSVVQAEVGWPVSGDGLVSRFIDEIRASSTPASTQHVFFRSNLLAKTAGLTQAGSSVGVVEWTNAFDRASGGKAVPAASTFGLLLLSAFLCGASVFVSRRRTAG